MIEIYFKDLSKQKQIELIEELSEEIVANIEPIAIIASEEKAI